MALTPRDLLLDELVKARDAGKYFMHLIGYVPDSTSRTRAKEDAESAIAYIQKLIDDHGE